MNFPGFVLAYHGCDREVGERILRGEEHVAPSTNDYDWLGSGAYFWENSPERAAAWASFLQSRRGRVRQTVRDPFVVGAIIDPGHCLDLIGAQSLAVLKQAFEEMVLTFRESGIDLPVNSAAFARDEDLVHRRLDCAVCQFLHTLHEENGQPAFDTLRAAFLEGAELHPGAGFRAQTHIQWCVRKPQQSIRGYFRPLPEP
jgi:hypothetical protein